MKRILFVLACALGLALLAMPAMAGEDFPPLRIKTDKDITVGYLSAELTNESSQRFWQQMQNEAEGRGWKLIYDTNATNEPEKERTAFQRILSQDPDVIIICIMDLPPIADLIVEARKKGIGVYSVAIADLVPGVLVDVSDSPGAMAATITEYAIARKSGQGKVVGFIDFWAPRGQRRDVVASALLENGGWSFDRFEHVMLTSDGYMDQIYSVSSQWATKYGKDLSLIWACWDSGAWTAARAAAEKGLTKDTFFTVGIDGGSVCWGIIRDGKIPFVGSLAEPFEYILHTACEAIKNAQIDGVAPGSSGSLIPASRIIFTNDKTVFIDESNVPAVGTNIHAVFNYYGGNPDDKNAWYSWGKPFVVGDGATDDLY